MIKGSMAAALVLAASVMGASGSHPLRGLVARAATTGQPPSGQKAAIPAAAREFQFHGLAFTIPASWSVRRADRQPFRPEFATVTGAPAGPRLTFSDSVALVGDGLAPAGPRQAAPGASGVSFERLEMPNPMMRGVVYLFREAGVTMSAQVRSEAEARAADAVAESARRVLPRRRPARS